MSRSSTDVFNEIDTLVSFAGDAAAQADYGKARYYLQQIVVLVSEADDRLLYEMACKDAVEKGKLYPTLAEVLSRSKSK